MQILVIISNISHYIKLVIVIILKISLILVIILKLQVWAIIQLVSALKTPEFSESNPESETVFQSNWVPFPYNCVGNCRKVTFPFPTPTISELGIRFGKLQCHVCGNELDWLNNGVVVSWTKRCQSKVLLCTTDGVVVVMT